LRFRNECAILSGRKVREDEKGECGSSHLGNSGGD